MNNVAKRYIIIAAIALFGFLAIVIGSNAIRNFISNRAFEIGVKKADAQVKVLQMQVQARDLIIAADSVVISGHVSCVDSLTKENARLKAYLASKQKNTSNEISTYRALPANERLRTFAKLVH